MSTIKGIINIAPGKAEIRDIPSPKLEPGYIKVKPTAWAINPDDVYHLDLEGEESCAGLPVGSDFAGVVVEVGPGVSRDFKVGDRIAGVVFGQNQLRKNDGAFAHLISVKSDYQMKVPDNLSDVDAATQGVALITMGVGLYRSFELPLPAVSPAPPSRFPFFIYGGSTAMGISAIQFAKLSGAKVITTSSPSNAEYLKSLGADHVLDYKSPTLVEDVLKLADGPLLHAFDTFPTDTSAAVCAAVLSRDGNAKYVGLVPGPEHTVKKLNPAVNARSILAYSASGDPWMYEKEYFPAVVEDFEFQKKFIVLAEKLFAEGLIKTPRVFLNRGGSGLEGILHGLEQSREGKVRGGKLVYTLENTTE
ncbi:GroES-like protein [Periconia macrospinosa]|uniref:GroES-like protein n=1 Tax=Periconia macrospinosa TaxID=97972 RepID=A0A2V1DS86_9PLEO|nr:GroES-like protein [Periconia macrospinosa]